MSENSPIDKFGRFVTESIRDTSIAFAEQLFAGTYKSESLIALQNQLTALDDESKALIFRFVNTVTDHAIHDFLFAVQQRSDQHNDIIIVVDGVDIAKTSDGLHGEPYGEDGWYARFSRYKEP